MEVTVNVFYVLIAFGAGIATTVFAILIALWQIGRKKTYKDVEPTDN